MILLCYYKIESGDKMKNIIWFICLVLVIISFAGCGSNAPINDENPQQSKAPSNLEISELSDEKLADIVAKDLGVPDNAGIEYSVTAEKYYFEAADRYYKNISFTKNGEIVAGASVDPYTGELLRNIFEYQN